MDHDLWFRVINKFLHDWSYIEQCQLSNKLKVNKFLTLDDIFKYPNLKLP